MLLIDVLTACGLGLLAFAALHDISFRTAPDWVSAGLLALGACLHIATGPLSALGWGVLVAFGFLLVTFLLWQFGMMGGGDVKLLTGASLFVPTTLMGQAHLVMGTALAGGVLSVVYLLGGFLVKRPGGPRPHGLLARVARCEQWRLSRRGPVPYAVAIAAGGVIATLNV